MIRFRQSGNALAVFFVIQVMKGAGVGCISFPVQAVIQSAAPHEQLSSITAAYLVIFYMSSGIGSAIGGSIWTNMIPRALASSLANVELETLAFGNPLAFKTQYPMGTPERQALNTAQDDAQVSGTRGVKRARRLMGRGSLLSSARASASSGCWWRRL
jgi:SIT family siderophore-iron:H+ symporter-like MFS transporter